MCKSAAEGGQRCASHTRTKFKAASRSDIDVWDQAAAEYASTPEGHEHLTGEATLANERNAHQMESRILMALQKGENMRAASKETADRIEQEVTALRQQATGARQRSQDSFDRSDTDGFMSQWAADTMAQKHDLEARVAEKGGQWEFRALFDMDGKLVPAKLVETKFGQAWAILEDPAATNSPIKGWVNPSKANKAETRRKNLAKKGYTEGSVLVDAKVLTGGSGTSIQHYVARKDGGFSHNAKIVSKDDDTVDY